MAGKTITDRQKRILITGASGFIGRFLVQEALRRGYKVWAGIRAGSSREYLQDKSVRFIDLKYGNRETLIRQVSNIASEIGPWHYVIHNAGITKSVKYDDFFKVNAENTHALIEALGAADCKPEKFLLMSSLGSYGPIKEHSFGPICVDDKQQPDNFYGKSKYEAEQFVKSQCYFPYVILCPTGVYGPGEKDYLLAIKSLKNGFDFKVGFKPQKITFIYVKDLISVVFLALENKKAANKTYLVADGETYTAGEFTKLVKQILSKKYVLNMHVPLWLCFLACTCSEFAGKILNRPTTLNKDKYKILKQRNWMCDIRPLVEDLNFTPQYNLEKGLKETIAYNNEKGLL